MNELNTNGKTAMLPTIEQPKEIEPSSTTCLILKANDQAVLSALTLALSAAAKKPKMQLNVHMIRWYIGPDYLEITGTIGATLHTVRIPAEQQPGKAESMEFCMVAADARKMVASVAGGSLMEIRIHQTVQAKSAECVPAEYLVETRRLGTRRQLIHYAFTGVNSQYPRYKEIMPSAGFAVASISGDAESLSEFLAPTNMLTIRLDEGQATPHWVVCGGAGLTIEGDLGKEEIDVSLPLAFLRHIPRNRLVQMEFSGRGGVVKMHCGLYGAVATCLFMPCRRD